FDGCLEQGVGLQGLARLVVHQHRRLVVAYLRGALEAALDRDLRRAAQAGGDLGRLPHHGQYQLTRTRVRGDLAHRRAGQDADRVERHVAEQLEPDVGAQVLLDGALQAARGHRLAERGAAAGDRAVRLSDGEPGPLDVPDHPWGLDLGRAVHHAADGVRRRDHGGDRAAWVDRLDAATLIGAGQAIEVPPRDAVLRGDDAGAGSQQRFQERARVSVAVRLQAEEHDVDRADLAGIGCGVRLRVEVTARAEHGDAALPDGLQVLAARYQANLRAAAVQCRANVRADRRGADDRDLHRAASPARLRRCTLPVGPFGISGRIVTRAGRLKAARRSAQCAVSSLGVASPWSTTTAPTCSPYFSSGIGYTAASATAGWLSSASSTS